MEALPFSDEHFDTVCGQYALEYSDTDKSVAELMRVLRGGGRLRFLLHSACGVLHERNREQSRQAKILLDSDLLAVTRAMLSAVVVGEAANNSAELHTGRQAIESLKVVMDRLADLFSKDTDRALPENVFAAIRRLAPLRHQHDIAQLLALVDDIERRLQAQKTRLQAMLDATLDDAKLQRLSVLFTANGAGDLRTGKALEGSHETVVGYWLDAGKV
jgi:ubiquinone/menaquinone biosynthesis C-methylase UbiE